MKQTWELVGTDRKDALGKCEAILKPIYSGQYQEMLHDMEPPCVPFIGAEDCKDGMRLDEDLTIKFDRCISNGLQTAAFGYHSY